MAALATLAGLAPTALGIANSVASGGLTEIVKTGTGLIGDILGLIGLGDTEKVEQGPAESIANMAKSVNMAANAVGAEERLPETADEWTALSHQDARKVALAARASISTNAKEVVPLIAVNAKDSTGIPIAHSTAATISRDESSKMAIDVMKPEHWTSVGKSIASAHDQRARSDKAKSSTLSFLYSAGNVPSLSDAFKGSAEYEQNPAVELIVGGQFLNDPARMVSPAADMMKYTSYDPVKILGNTDIAAPSKDGNAHRRAGAAVDFAAVIPDAELLQRQNILDTATQLYSALSGAQGSPARRATLSGAMVVAPQQPTAGPLRTNNADACKGQRLAFQGSVSFDVKPANQQNSIMMSWPLKFAIVSPIIFEVTRTNITDFVYTLNGKVNLFLATLSADILPPDNNTKMWTQQKGDFLPMSVLIVGCTMNNLNMRQTTDIFQGSIALSAVKSYEMTVRVINEVTLTHRTGSGPTQIIPIPAPISAPLNDPAGAPYTESQCHTFQGVANGMRVTTDSSSGVLFFILPNPRMKVFRYYPEESIWLRPHVDCPNFWPKGHWFTDGPGLIANANPLDYEPGLRGILKQFINPTKDGFVSAIVDTEEKVDGAMVTVPRWTDLTKKWGYYRGRTNNNAGVNSEGIYTERIPLGDVISWGRAILAKNADWRLIIGNYNWAISKAKDLDPTDPREFVTDSPAQYLFGTNLYGMANFEAANSALISYIKVVDDFDPDYEGYGMN